MKKRNWIVLTGISVSVFYLFAPLTVSADMPIATYAPEYNMMQQGTFPTEVTFSDTSFNCSGHAVTESIITEINGEPNDEHEFTIKANDRIDFVLEGSYLYPIKPEYETLIHWSPAQSWAFLPAIHANGDGVYLLCRNPESYRMEVTDFGFDTDLSDLKTHFVMTINMDAYKLFEEDSIPDAKDPVWSQKISDMYPDESEFTDKLSIRAEGDATISPFTPGSIGDYMDDYMLLETDSVGFQFVPDENTEWEFSMNGNVFTPEKVRFRYGSVCIEDPEGYSATEEESPEEICYQTLSIVLVDSDLVERETTVIKEWKESIAELEANSQKPSTEETEVEETETIETETEQETIAEPESPKKESSFPIGGIIAAVAVLAGAGIFFMTRKKN